MNKNKPPSEVKCASVNLTKRVSASLLGAALALCLTAANPTAAEAQVINLGTSSTFAVLAHETVTSTGLTIVTGNLGVSPGLAVVGFPPGIVNGTIYTGPLSLAGSLQTDATAANAALLAAPCTTVLTGTDLGTLPLPLNPGVYCFASSAQLTGTLYLDAQNNAGAQFIFKIGSTLTTASNSSVIVLNGPSSDCNGSNVFWQVGSSATIGTGTTFVGNIIALASVSMTAGANMTGRAFALTGAVTMIDNNVSTCSSGISVGASRIKVTGGGQIGVPDPNSTGQATFGFNAKAEPSGGPLGHFNYVNHVTGLHVSGPVTNSGVIAATKKGLQPTVIFFGTCASNLPACTFVVTVQDNGEPGTSDQFGITVTDALNNVVEARSLRVISKGNIQFHKE